MKLTTAWKIQTTLDNYMKKPKEDLDIPSYGASTEHKLENTFRVGFQNVNGIRRESDRTGAEELYSMDKLGLDLAGLIETNINWTIDQKLTLSAMIRLRFRHGRAVTSSMRSTKEGYQPGGTAMIVRGPTCGRVYRRGADSMGRFTWIALRGKGTGGILVVTAYRVCQNAETTAGPDTAYMREWTELRRRGYEYPDPRNQILTDISELIDELSQRGYHPLILMDANAVITEKNLSDFCLRHRLIDLVNDSNDGEPPSTYNRGTRRIDFPLGDDFVRKAVVKSGCLASHEGISFSDNTM